MIDIKLEISYWTHHINQLIYSYFYFCQKNDIKFKLVYNSEVRYNGAILHYLEKKAFLDYEDDPKSIVNPHHYDLYFKRSLSPLMAAPNAVPLNFNIPLSYKPFKFLWYLDRKIMFKPQNRRELYRALDFFNLKIDSAHSVFDIRNFDNRIIDNNGKVIYYTRLWNPNNGKDDEEEQRRINQNYFRINACRQIKKYFAYSSVGLFPDEYAIDQAPDLVLDFNQCKKPNYLKTLRQYDIGVVDDGLKDAPGWKIGEYLLNSMAIISTPINIKLNNFKEGVNYLATNSRTDFESVPQLINNMILDKRYIDVAHENQSWASKYLFFDNYFKNILDTIDQF